MRVILRVWLDSRIRLEGGIDGTLRGEPSRIGCRFPSETALDPAPLRPDAGECRVLTMTTAVPSPAIGMRRASGLRGACVMTSWKRLFVLVLVMLPTATVRGDDP